MAQTVAGPITRPSPSITDVELEIDAQGRFYVGGYYYGSVTIETTTLTSAQNSSCVFAACFTASRTLQWAVSSGSTGTQTAYQRLRGFGVDSNGNAYLAVSLVGVGTFGTATITSTPPSG